MLQDAAMQDAHTAEPVTIGPRSSIAELRRLNQERWERQLAEEEAPTASVQGGGDSAPVACLLYTSPSPRDRTRSRMPSSA